MLRKLNQILRSSRAAVDLGTIIVGVVIIGIIGAVSAATIFALVPWMQDRGTKQQLMLVATAENTHKGAYDVYSATLATDVVNTYNAKIAVFSNEDDCWAAFKTSDTGKTFYSSSKSADPQQVPTTWPTTAPATYPANCPWPSKGPLKSGNLFDDPKYDNGSGWASYFAPTASTDTKEYLSAPQSRKIVSTAASDGIIVFQTKYVKNGTYFGGVWFKAPAGTTWHVALRTDTPYTEGAGGNQLTATGKWQFAQASGNVTNSPAKVGVQLKAVNGAVGQIANFDDVALYQQ